MDGNNVSVYETSLGGGDGKGTGMVKPEDMPLLHERLFEILSYFDEFCEKYHIRYTMAAGTCLGAVREHDFIPWDDDLDVGVLREDYDRLFELWKKYGDKERFSLYRTEGDFCAYVPVGILRSNKTTFIREFEVGLTDRNLGVKIDIEPLDEIPEDPKLRKKQKLFAYLYVLFLTRRKPRQEQKQWYLKIGANILLAVFRGKKLRNWIVKKVEPQVKKYNGTGCRQLAINGLGLGSIREMTDVTEATKMLFHGKMFNVPAEYDRYLTKIYGDYMKKPPVEKRKPLDTPSYYDLNLPYSEYLKNNSKK